MSAIAVYFFLFFWQSIFFPYMLKKDHLYYIASQRFLLFSAICRLAYVHIEFDPIKGYWNEIHMKEICISILCEYKKWVKPIDENIFSSSFNRSWLNVYCLLHRAQLSVRNEHSKTKQKKNQCCVVALDTKAMYYKYSKNIVWNVDKSAVFFFHLFLLLFVIAYAKWSVFFLRMSTWKDYNYKADIKLIAQLIAYT